MGDGFNWELMIYCAAERKAELMIVSRDADYGVTLEIKCHLNDHLRQEFKQKERPVCNLCQQPACCTNTYIRPLT